MMPAVLGPSLKLRLLGPPGLEVNGQPRHLATRKALALLAFLAVERAGATRGQLVALLWPENPEELARASLRQEVSRLGKLLGPALQKDGQQLLRLDPCWIEVDLWAFQEALATGRYRTALQLYRGPFLQGLQPREAASFEHWLEQVRSSLQQSYLEALHTQARQEEAQGHPAEALALWRLAIAADPLSEQPYLEAMRLCEAQGDRAAALRIYRSLEQTLWDELGLSPSPEAQTWAARLNPDPAIPSLPSPPTPLVGRETEQAEVWTLLQRPDCRLLNLIGPGGVGKTRLALALAERLTTQKATVYWVPVQGRPLYESLAEALGLAASGKGNLQEALRHHLSHRPAYLFLDEAEELSDPQALEDLLRHSPQVKLVLTSRVRFRLRSEWVYEVRGLPYPPPDQPPQRSPAAELFYLLAQRVQPHFTPSAEDWSAIGQICRLLSGLPLGLELAAALLRVMSCQEIAQNLQQGLELLEGGLSNLPDRHSSLQKVLESSLAQLSPAEQEALQKLAVFEETFDLIAAQAVAASSPGLLSALLDRALLQKQPDGYRMLTVIRQYLAPGIPPTTRQAHAGYYAELLERHEQGLRGGNQVGALPLLTRQYADLRAAWQFALQQEEYALALRMMEGLCLLLELRGWFKEGEALMSSAAQNSHPLLRSLALGRWGRFLYLQGQNAAAYRVLQQSLELGQGHIDPYETAYALNNLGMAAMGLGLAQEARELFTQSLAMRRQQRRPWGLGSALYNLGSLALLQGDFAQAQGYLQEALEVYRALSDARGLGLVLAGLGQLYTSLGEYTVAREVYRQSLSFGRQLDDPFTQSAALLGLGTVAGIEYQNEECNDHLQAGLEAAYQTGDQITIGRALVGLGRLAMRDGAYERALKLQRQALERFVQSQYPWGEALVYNHLGRSYFALEEIAQSKACYRLALEQALRLGAIPLALRALIGLTPHLPAALATQVWRLAAHHPSADAWVREELRRRSVARLAPSRVPLEKLAQQVLQKMEGAVLLRRPLEAVYYASGADREE